MRCQSTGLRACLIAAVALLPVWTCAALLAQATQPASGLVNQGQSPPAGPQQGPPPPRFPAQLRPPEDPVIVERGRRIYGVSCRSCHGADLRGGDMGGPNLLRSSVALNDQNGELIGTVLASGRGNMPAMPLPAPDVSAVAAYVRSVLAAGRAQGAPPPGEQVRLNIVVGDPRAGEAYFTSHCSSCHSPNGDLRGLASRVADPTELQNLWVGGGRDRGGLTAADPAGPRDATATVTPRSGAPVTGRLHRIDDFVVTLALPDGTHRSFRRVGDEPRVEVKDPLASHLLLLGQYTDNDIHDVTAYLVTLR